MTSKRKRIRRGVAGVSLGLTVFGGGLVLTGLPAADAATYNCTNGIITDFGLKNHQADGLLDTGFFTCTRNERPTFPH